MEQATIAPSVDRHYVRQKASKLSSIELSAYIDTLCDNNKYDEAAEYAKVLLRRGKR